MHFFLLNTEGEGENAVAEKEVLQESQQPASVEPAGEIDLHSVQEEEPVPPKDDDQAPSGSQSLLVKDEEEGSVFQSQPPVTGSEVGTTSAHVCTRKVVFLCMCV